MDEERTARGRLGRRGVLSGGLAAATIAAVGGVAPARRGDERGTAGTGTGEAGIKVFMSHDGNLRVRIGHVDLGSASLGSWYGGTGAVRLLQVFGTWFHAYQLDDHGYRGTTALPEAEFWRVHEYLPSAQLVWDGAGTTNVYVSDADLAALGRRVMPLRTRVARFGKGMAALFGDFPIASRDMFSLGLFHLDGHRFNGFRTGFHHTALLGGDVSDIAARLPSARLLREGSRTVVEVGDADFGLLLGAAEEV